MPEKGPFDLKINCQTPEQAKSGPARLKIEFLRRFSGINYCF